MEELLVAKLQETFGVFRHRMMGNIFAFARDKGLTMGQFGALMHIHHKGECGVSDIGNDLGITNSAASQMLDRLVQLKLITRTEDPSDRRLKLIELTDRGRQVLHEGMLANQAWLEALAHTMSAGEQQQVQDALVILLEKAQQLDTIPALSQP